MRFNIVLGEVAYNDVELAILKLPASAFCGCDSEKDASEVGGRGVHPLILLHEDSLQIYGNMKRSYLRELAHK